MLLASLQQQSSATVTKQLAEYFKLHQEVLLVPIFEDHMKSTTTANGTITGKMHFAEFSMGYRCHSYVLIDVFFMSLKNNTGIRKQFT